VTVSFGFATDEELGWDETVGRTSISADGVNMITVDNRTYEIIETISDFRAFSILGRATRIFIAQDVISTDNEKVVIKDIWADGTRSREHQIQEQIQEDLIAGGFPDMEKYFFEHLAFGDVLTSNGEPDTTVNISQNAEGKELNLSDFQCISIRPEPKETAPSNSAGLPPSHNTSMPVASNAQNTTPHPLPLNAVPRVHYRLVMKEVGTPLQNVYDLGKCLDALENLNDRKYSRMCGFCRVLISGQLFLRWPQYHGYIGT
jgi:hypothetical protein